jgi:hypothetical protein
MNLLDCFFYFLLLLRVALIVLGLSGSAEAQQPKKAFRMGYLASGQAA